MTTSGLTKRATKVASKVLEQFSEIANDFYLSEDIPILESISFGDKKKHIMLIMEKKIKY